MPRCTRCDGYYFFTSNMKLIDGKWVCKECINTPIPLYETRLNSVVIDDPASPTRIEPGEGSGICESHSPAEFGDGLSGGGGGGD